MAHDVTDQIRQLEAERQRLEGLLSRYPVWRALRQLDAAERLASDRASRDPASLARLARERADLEAQLDGNAVFEAHRSVVAALHAMAPRNETRASPAAQQNAPAVDKSTAVAPPEESALTPARQVELVAVARVPRMPASGVTRTATIHPALPGADQAAMVKSARAEPDGLTRIRRIDRALAAALVARGVRTYGQIAAFGSADVKALAAALGLGRRISQENWIEQAAVLAARQAAALPSGLAPAALPNVPTALSQVASIIPSQSGVQPAAKPAASPPAPVPAATVGLAARAIAARVLRGHTPQKAVVTSPQAGLTAVAESVPAAAAGEGGAAMPAAPALVTPAASLVGAAARRIAGTLDTRKAASDEPPAIEPVLPIVPPPPPEPDDLTRIAGIDAAIAATLSAAGITTFAGLAGATSADAARISGALAVRARGTLGSWIEQAAMLMRGDVPALAWRQACGELACLVPRPAVTVERDAAFAAWLAEHSRSFATAQIAEPPPAQADVSSAPRPAEATGEVIAADAAAPVAADASSAPAVPAQPDTSDEGEASRVGPESAIVALVPPDAEAADVADMVPPFVTAPPLSISDRITAIERDIATLEFRPKPASVRGTLTPKAPVREAVAAQAEPASAARVVEANVEIVRNDQVDVPLPAAEWGLVGEGNDIGSAAQGFDASTYAGYAERIEEASVDIVRNDPAMDATAAAGASDARLDAPRDGRTVRRFLKALTGN